MKIQLFIDSSLPRIQESINKWLKENQNCSILSLDSTISSEGNLLITILYEE